MTKTVSYKSTIDIYKHELKTRKPLTVEQEREIGRRIAAGDEMAFAELIEANTRYAFSFAKKYDHGSVPFEDIVEAANMGLIMAAKRYDVTYGTRFLTFANKWMLKYIMEYLDREMKGRGIVDAEGNYFRHGSLDSFFGTDEDGCLYDVVADERTRNFEDVVGDGIDFETIMNFRHILTDREYEVIVRFYGLFGHEEETLASIGRSFSVSREAIRQSKDSALEKIRKYLSYKLVA